MSSTSSPPLHCEVHSRRTERRVATVALTAGALAPFMAGLPGDVSMLCALAATLLIGSGLRRAGWLRPEGGIAAMSWLADGRWLLTDRRGRAVEGVLRSESRVGRRGVWLRWDVSTHESGRPGVARRSLLLAGGDMPANELRRLIVRLRLEGAGNLPARPHGWPAG